MSDLSDDTPTQPLDYVPEPRRDRLDLFAITAAFIAGIIVGMLWVIFT